MGIHHPAVGRGGQGGHREVASEEPEARSRAVTKVPFGGQLEPVGQAEDAEPAARWRRHILDESAAHGVCGQHGTISVERLTRGSLAGSGGMGPSVVDPIRETEVGPRCGCEVTHEPEVAEKRG